MLIICMSQPVSKDWAAISAWQGEIIALALREIDCRRWLVRLSRSLQLCQVKLCATALRTIEQVKGGKGFSNVVLCINLMST